MASYRGFPSYVLELGVYELFGHCTTDADGVSTLVRGVGITSVTNSDEGEYTILLEQKFARFIHADAIVVKSTALEGEFQVKSFDMATGTVILMFSGSGTAVDIDSAAFRFRLVLSNVEVVA